MKYGACNFSKFEILFIKPEKCVDKTMSIRYFRKLGVNIFLKPSSCSSYFRDSLIQLKHIWGFYTCLCKSCLYPALLILCVRSNAHTHASTHATSLTRVKIARTTSVYVIYDTYCLRYWSEENERKNKNTKFNIWSLFFNLC